MPALVTCAYCGSPDLHVYLSLGAQPPSNAFIAADQVAAEQRYPLDVALCRACSLSQLTFVVPSREIFDRYVYLSSTSAALREHYARLAQGLVDRHRLGPGDVVVDVGCNDGVLLGAFPATLRRVGVEPSQVADVARARGLDVVRGYFDGPLAGAIVAEHGHARLLTATNVFAHVDDPAAFVAGVRTLLADDGVFVIEASYLPDIIDGCLFDTIYHEHLRYLSLTAVVPFMRRHGLVVLDAERVPFGASGPAIRVHVGRRGEASPAVDQLLAWERRWGVGEVARYGGFAGRVASVRERLRDVLGRIGTAGGRVAGYGAPAKGNTLLNYVGLGPHELPYLADTNPLKQGLLAPGSHIPVVPEERLLDDMPEYALLLSWNYADHFVRHSEYVARGGRFVVPLPTTEIRPPPGA